MATILWGKRRGRLLVEALLVKGIIAPSLAIFMPGLVIVQKPSPGGLEFHGCLDSGDLILSL
jgi:hypothetical protein